MHTYLIHTSICDTIHSKRASTPEEETHSRAEEKPLQGPLTILHTLIVITDMEYRQ